ncbi:hypothetical protein AB0B10_06190 [Micromonospora arborensis]|uniref:hypothetical protein n=1 Tax=Micromonospora arborensis TaxID=2116518 RepID=UPI0034017CC7
MLKSTVLPESPAASKSTRAPENSAPLNNTAATGEAQVPASPTVGVVGADGQRHHFDQSAEALAAVENGRTAGKLALRLSD